MHAENILAAIAVGGGVITILGGGGVLGWWWRRQPQREEERQRRRAADEAIIGKGPVYDEAGGVMVEGQPGLVHLQRQDSQRLQKVEEAIVEFRHAQGLYTELAKQVSLNTADIAALKNTHVKDIVTAAERAATAAASAEMLRLAAERDTLAGEADEPAGEVEP